MTQQRQLLRPAVLVLALALCGASAAAQGGTRVVKGQVLDENGKPVAGAVVRLKDKTTKKEVSVITDKNGRYQFNSVKLRSDYRIQAEKAKQRSRSRGISQMDTRTEIFMHLRLQPPKEPAEKKPSKEEKDN
jgi:protocatechuate 3,4-dioxygenase beta subunit